MLTWLRTLFTANPASEQPRLDLVDLLRAEFDRPPQAPAPKTLIICSAPRTGSYELCRLLAAAGLGIPHEYFHPDFSPALAARWGLADPLSPSGIAAYIEALRQRRASGGVFAAKIQHWQFDKFLRNSHGAMLFDDALTIHLFRADATAQFASYRRACVSGRWDFSPRVTSEPRADTIDDAITMLDELVAQDAGFRRIFALAGINPMFVTFEDVARDPGNVVKTIARALGVIPDHAGVARALAQSKSSPYARAYSQENFEREFHARAFGQIK
jgi:LPS sulfotransferase NodH